ncbi:DUF2267 domain-containing protein [Halogeometricum sp. S1BR25-6]|uniref:DUF2267 domain-containing protein n=1 Tax=Halogeometricum salsisoli TaxID=2950536 RepID=A0ABU2GEL6_9EURY|nr:DUF2267 domain-containing protein [Halogeometricum sp. S1BR25-6]MDS0298553.1 DUF2267 domain-containing protein [Halogeometricum sp. S1BR25-6]
MDFDTFLGEVESRGQLASTEDALRATRITFEALGRRVDAEDAERLGAQLPGELERFLTKEDAVERFAWGEFVGRLVEAGDYDEGAGGTAAYHARVVLSVVDDATTEGAVGAVRERLPAEEDWDELFALVDRSGQAADAE